MYLNSYIRWFLDIYDHLGEVQSLEQPRLNALLLGVIGSGPHPDGHGHLETTKINLIHHTQQLFLQKLFQKSSEL